MPSNQLMRIIRDLRRHCRTFDADRVGEDVLDLVVEEQMRDFDAEVDPDGSRWPDLSAAYLEFKRRYAATTKMGHLHGNLATEENFRGQRYSDRHEARSAFGTTEQAKDEAEWFEEGDPAMNRPPRHFLGISPLAEQRIDSFLDEQHRKNL